MGSSRAEAKRRHHRTRPDRAPTADAARPPAPATPLLHRAAVGLLLYLCVVAALGGGSSRLPPELLRAEAVDAVLDTHTMLHVGGPHRGGTTLLSDLLEAHPLVHGLGAPENGIGSRSAGVGGTKGPLNEGIFLQSVFPRFGLAMGPVEIAYRTVTGTLRQNGTGWGAYAYAPTAHLTEANETGLLTDVSRRQLMTEWGRKWACLNLSELNSTISSLGDEVAKPERQPRTVLLEKSPTNIMMWRFLEALWRLPSRSTRPGGRTARLDVKFLFISRHPLAVAAAQRSWADASHLSVHQLVEHWIYQQETLAADIHARTDASTLRVHFEQLADDPIGTLIRVFVWLGIEDETSAREAATTVLQKVPVKGGTNLKYHSQFCASLARDGCVAYNRMIDALEPSVLKTGYSLREWGSSCKVACAAQNRFDTK
ncbi:hypothetical protein AB1Y20_019952 [Prymnesium parvum]|uniref:Protein-tyrosine sulfotransferase n=1 Tax=Prymnesium parvum TaxID=97485 RepID=A0AB34JTQ1_PRYPA